jgi:hypothetical protein
LTPNADGRIVGAFMTAVATNSGLRRRYTVILNAPLPHRMSWLRAKKLNFAGWQGRFN